jgi:hypothetical protein
VCAQPLSVASAAAIMGQMFGGDTMMGRLRQAAAANS